MQKKSEMCPNYQVSSLKQEGTLRYQCLRYQELTVFTIFLQAMEEEGGDKAAPDPQPEAPQGDQQEPMDQ